MEEQFSLHMQNGQITILFLATKNIQLGLTYDLWISVFYMIIEWSLPLCWHVWSPVKKHCGNISENKKTYVLLNCLQVLQVQ